MGTGQDGAAEQRRIERERQAEILGPLDFSRGKFEHARIIAQQTGFKQTRNGDIEVTLLIPFRYRDQAMDLLDASAVPLDVDIVPWKRNATHERIEGFGG